MTALFEDKVVLITGAARGLGASHALAFAREGAKVAVSDICREQDGITYGMGSGTEMGRLVGEIKAMGRPAMGVTCDVSKAREVEAMAERVMDQFGRIDILVNNVAATNVPLWEVREEVWDLIVNVMLKGTYLCSKYVLPHMIKQRYGKIVNIGSTAARGHGRNAPYSAVKAGIQTLTLAMAKEVGEYGINVNCVSPGPVMTPMVEGAMREKVPDTDIPSSHLYDKAIKQFSILGQEITPADITEAVLFLSSEKARNIDGSNIYVDGGFLSI
jgi:NAD(P)-dependent dehydrogenase (short-subunit alcohol dehydrogenase family)